MALTLPVPPIQPKATVNQNSNGVLSITYLGERRSLCDEEFTAQDARTVCTELYGTPDYFSYSLGHQCDYDNFWISRINCNGDETRVQDCVTTPLSLSLN